MQSFPDLVSLSFLLPDGADPQRAAAHYRPLYDGNFTLYAAGLATFGADSRRAVFTNAAAFIRELSLSGPVEIAATVITAGAPGMPSGRDGWTLIVGAEVAFCPTGLGAQFPALPARPPPALAVIAGGRRA